MHSLFSAYATVCHQDRVVASSCVRGLCGNPAGAYKAISVHSHVALTEAVIYLCSILTRMRVVISEGVLEKRTALLIQNFLEQVCTLLLAS